MSSVYTKEELHAEISLWKKALTACATGKSYTIDGRTLTRQDLPAIREHLSWLADLLAAAEKRSSRILVRPIIRR